MKILYGISTTGLGHVSRSIEIIKNLQKHADIDILLSGPKLAIKFPFRVKYKLKGLTMPFDMKGGIDLVKTVQNADLLRVFNDIKGLNLHGYDRAVSDFDPVTSWAARQNQIKSIGVAHQYSIFSKKLRNKYEIPPFYDTIIRLFAGCDLNLGINYFSLDKNMYTPIIREGIKNAKTTKGNHITVYLALHSPKLQVKLFQKFKDYEWHLFVKKKPRMKIPKNIKLYKIDKENFTHSLLSSYGIICSAGFTLTSEALYLGKKLLTVSIRNHAEQEINIRMLKTLGIKTITNLDHLDEEIEDWLNNFPTVKMDYHNVVPEIVDRILN